jgi:SAM-dependent methyltransferase
MSSIDSQVYPMNCPVCGVATSYVYNIDEGKGKEALWYRCNCGVVFQENYPKGQRYSEKYVTDYAKMKEGDKRLTHSARNYGNLIEELTYGRMMLDVGYCVPHNMEFFKKRGWLTWGIDINENIGGEGHLYKGDFLTYDFDIPANTADLKELAGGDKFKRTFDLVWMNHVLEHFKRREVFKVLTEWMRILKPGGILRVSVPDFAGLCKVYHQYGKLELVVGALFGRQDYLYNIHYNVFDFQSLKKILEDVGFENVQHYDWRGTEHANIDDYSQAYIPHMDKENGTLISLNVECNKNIS